MEVNTMKKSYISPEIEISVFASEDIITASGNGNSDDNPTITNSLKTQTNLSDSEFDVAYTSLFSD